MSVVGITVALHWWAAAEVRRNTSELVLLSLGGAAWLIVASNLFPWLGLSVLDDAVERRNIAALVALCGAVIGVAITYAGANLGEGPSYWNNLFSVALGTGGLLCLWILLELSGRVSVSIAEHRDLASGMRLCGFLIATGLILGRAVAGDWHSEAATLRDYWRDGWPAMVLCATALAIERLARPSQARPFPPWLSFGSLPVLFHLGMAIGWLWYLGPWEGKPQ